MLRKLFRVVKFNRCLGNVRKPAAGLTEAGTVLYRDRIFPVMTGSGTSGLMFDNHPICLNLKPSQSPKVPPFFSVVRQECGLRSLLPRLQAIREKPKSSTVTKEQEPR